MRRTTRGRMCGLRKQKLRRGDFAGEAERRIRELVDALYVARATIIDLVAEPLRSVLDAQGRCDHWNDLHAWERWAIERTIAQAKPVRSAFGRARTLCPLCEPHTAWEEWNTLAHPIGLERHLAGSHRMRRCSVFEAAWGMCRDQLVEWDRGEPRLRLDEYKRPKPWEIKPPPPPTPPLAPVVQIAQARLMKR